MRKGLRWVIPSTVSLLISFGLMAWRGLFTLENSVDRMQCISDGFFAPAVFFCGIGLLLLISQSGFFDALTFGFHSLIRLFTPINRESDKIKFYDYKVMKAEKRGKPSYVLLVIGAADLLLALLFLGLYTVLQ